MFTFFDPRDARKRAGPLGITDEIVIAFLAPEKAGLKPREARRQLFLRARMRAGGVPVDICIRNISSQGMLLQAATPPPRGTYVEIMCPNLTVTARVVWTKDRRFGVQTRAPMDVSAVIGGAGSAIARPAQNLPSQSIPLLSGTKRPSLSAVDRSRHLSSTMEFGFFLVCSIAAAVCTAYTIFQFLADMVRTVTDHL